MLNDDDLIQHVDKELELSPIKCTFMSKWHNKTGSHTSTGRVITLSTIYWIGMKILLFAPLSPL